MAIEIRVLSLAVLAIGAASLALVLCRYPPAFVLWPKNLLVAFVAFSLAFAVALGSDQMRGSLNFINLVAARDGGLTHVIVDGVAKDVAVLRSGEEGLLIYEKSFGKFSFIKWDAIKALEWSRDPMIRNVPRERKQLLQP